MFEITVDGLGSASAQGPAAEAAETAHRASVAYSGRLVQLSEDGHPVATFLNGRKRVRKVAGFASASAPADFQYIDYVPEPARRVGFGLAA